MIGLEPISTVPQTDVLPIKLQTIQQGVGFEPTILRPQRNVLPTKLSLHSVTTGLEPIPLNLEFNILPIKLRHRISNLRHQSNSTPAKLHPTSFSCTEIYYFYKMIKIKK